MIEKYINKRITILDTNKNMSDFDSVSNYLLYTYGEKKLEASMHDREFTHLDVIGYTLNNGGFEREDENIKGYYELNEIEKCMWEKWDRKKN